MTFVQHPMASPPKDSYASPKNPNAPQPSPKDIRFLDPSLQHDFPELCLFNDALPSTTISRAIYHQNLVKPMS